MEFEQIKSLTDEHIMTTYGRLPVAFDHGKGVHLWDTTGKQYLNLLAGIAVCNLGHSHPRITLAICEQASRLIHTSNLYHIGNQARLAKLLCDNSCFDKAFFCNSGAEANEAAIKLARKWAKVQGHPEKFEVVTALNSFHGRTLVTITATGQEKYQKWFTPLPAGFRYVPLNDLAALEAAVTDATCAIMLEPIQGESGVRPASATYLAAARRLADERGALLIFDEVQTGNGRTGKLWGYELSGIEPDVATLAKGLANGLPIGACLAKDSACVFEPGDHASTFGGNPLVCAAALAVWEEFIYGEVLQNCQRTGAYFKQQLELLAEQTGLVEEVRGWGLMLGCEFKREIAGEVNAKLLEHGILANAIANKTLRFVPPLILQQEHVDQAVEALREILTEYV